MTPTGTKGLSLSLLSLKIVNTGNTSLSRFFISAGIPLTENDEEQLKKHPNNRSVEVMRQLGKIELVQVMEENLSKKPSFSEVFEVSFHTEFSDGKKLFWSKALPNNKMSLFEALNACPPPSRLPTNEEYEKLSEIMNSNGSYQPNYFVNNPGYERDFSDDGQGASMPGYFFWSSVYHPVNKNFVYGFSSRNGHMYDIYHSSVGGVRCVIGAD